MFSSESAASSTILARTTSARGAEQQRGTPPQLSTVSARRAITNGDERLIGATQPSCRLQVTVYVTRRNRLALAPVEFHAVLPQRGQGIGNPATVPVVTHGPRR